MRKTAFCFLLLWAAIDAAGADLFEPVRTSIRRQLVERQVPSIAVAVAREGKIIWEEGFGWADRENRVASNEHTLYSLASISKPITATGLMILKEQGKIDLDRPINDYLGEAKVVARVGDAHDATVRRVANHSSGLPLHYHFFYEDEPYRVPSREETIRRYGNLVTPPGERYQYSNLGFGILDYVISRVSGNTYADFMREQVFLPLGLTHAAVGVPPRLAQQQAIRYGTDGLPIPVYDFDHTGASAIYSSAHDLVRFGMFHLKAHLSDQKAILSDQAIEEMQKPTVKTGERAGYGIGWATNDTRSGYRTVSHSGGMGGVTTLLRLVPSKKIAVVVLANSNSPLPLQICNEILSALLPDFQPGSPSDPPNASRPAAFRPPPELTGKWKGSVHTYSGDLPFDLEFHGSGDVHARLGQQLATLLNDARFEDGYLTGRLAGDIGTEDANRRP
ncbi:MAG: beta-lactamase family protein [Acidobacteria bacterium]|nr:beta-lactamase family protein [Acidobacteriota bacterium]